MKNSLDLSQKRVFFASDKIRNKFFSLLKNKFNSWKELRNFFGLYKSRLERFRNGTISLSYFEFLNFLEHIKEKDIFLKNIIIKDKNWGRIKGGHSTYKKHKNIFEKGRRIVNKNKKTKYFFNYNYPLDENLCELIGAFIGDGFTNKYANNYMTQFAGDRRFDKTYMLNKLIPIIKKIGPNSNPIITEKENSIRLTVNSKEFHKLLTKRFNFKAGKKCYDVEIPKEIINSINKSHLNYCIRGIFDTDGCVFFDKRKSYKKHYIRIALNLENPKLIKQLTKFLTKKNINISVNKDFKRIQINGIENCKKFVKQIGFSNPRHLNKLNESLVKLK